MRASLAAIDAIRHVEKRARFIQAEPAIHIVADPARPRDRKAAEASRLSQFEAWEMLTGNLAPELGGSPDHLDVVGVNYYWNNQWIHRGRTLLQRDPLYRPFRHILQEIHHRYKRALFIAETGREGDQRALWLRFIAEEVRAAFSAGVPVEGICIYPIIDYPGWDNERHCPCGLLGAAQPLSTRPVYEPLAAELRRQQAIFHSLFGEPRGRNLAGRVDTGRRTPNCQAQSTIAFEGLVDTDNAPDTQADTRTGQIRGDPERLANGSLTPGESRVFAPAAVEGTGERDSPVEERRFEPSVPLAVKTLSGRAFRRPLAVRQQSRGARWRLSAL